MLNKTVYIISILFFLSSCAAISNSDTNPQASYYNMQLGLAYLQQGQRSLAKEKLLLATDQDPNSVAAWDALAYYFDISGDTENAENFFQKAILVQPHSGRALNNYGAFLCRQKRYQQGMNYLLKAVNEVDYTNTAEAYKNAGLCALQMHDKNLAKKYFQMAKMQGSK